MTVGIVFCTTVQSSVWFLYPQSAKSFWKMHVTYILLSYDLAVIKWAASWQNQSNGCAPSEDSDQPGHPPSLIRVFAVRMKKAWVLSHPLSAQQRLWSDWADAQADLSLRWAHSHFVGFVMSWLKWFNTWLLAHNVMRTMKTFKAIKSQLKQSHDKQILTLVIFSYEICETCWMSIHVSLYLKNVSLTCQYDH